MNRRGGWGSMNMRLNCTCHTYIHTHTERKNKKLKQMTMMAVCGRINGINKMDAFLRENSLANSSNCTYISTLYNEVSEYHKGYMYADFCS